MKKWLTVYFDLSKREFNGLLTLVVLILAIGGLPYMYGLMTEEPGYDEAGQISIEKMVFETWPEERSKKPEANKKALQGSRKKDSRSLFLFDPNQIDLKGWQRLGLSEKQSAAILKYIARGGRFKKREDLQKMYTINEQMYKRLAPYVSIGPEMQGDIDKNVAAGRPLSLMPEIIEVNQADSAGLCKVRGIGPSFASRIIKYRQRLGGFYKKEQLTEVFGLDSVKYKELSSQIAVDQTMLRKVNVNAAQFEDLKDHPYLRYKQINALIQYRKQHGNYSNIADLNKVLILDQETITKIAPYLTF